MISRLILGCVMSLLNMTPSSTCFAMSLVRTGYWYILISMIALNKSKTFLHSSNVNQCIVKFFSRPALQSESSPPWIFSTFAKRFTSISCRKQTRYFSAYSGDPLLANMFGPYSYLTTCFLKAVALQGTHPSRPKNSTIGGLVAMSKLHPGGEEPNNLE